MEYINMLEAKTNLSRLIASLESKEKDRIVIARHGTPVAVLSLYEQDNKRRKLGKFDGKYNIPDDFDSPIDEVFNVFGE